MEILVTGTIRTSVGDPPKFYAHAEGELLASNTRVRFHSTILGGHAFVAFSSETPALSQNDEAFRFARHILENLIFAKVVDEGIGLQYTLEHCRSGNDEVVKAVPDRTGETGSKGPTYEFVTHAMGQDPRLRYAIRDFNGGLVDRESCPLYFYRAIETIARIVSGNDSENLKAGDWSKFHSTIGTSPELVDRLLKFSKPHRHGSHAEFSKEDHLEMMRITREVIIRFVNSQNQAQPG